MKLELEVSISLDEADANDDPLQLAAPEEHKAAKAKLQSIDLLNILSSY